MPDFIGNRSPYADPDVRGVVAGLGLDAGAQGLEDVYVAGLCGLGYATAEVMEALRASGVACDTLVVSGGASRSPLVRRIMADATGVPVISPETPEPVLLGSAMLGTVAGGLAPSLPAAMARMSRVAETMTPQGGEAAAFHAAKRRVYDRLRAVERETRALMEEAPLLVQHRVSS
jgi:D-ribulokinase